MTGDRRAGNAGDTRMHLDQPSGVQRTVPALLAQAQALRRPLGNQAELRPAEGVEFSELHAS